MTTEHEWFTLKKHFKGKKYLGKEEADLKDFTAARIDVLKRDLDDEMGWKKHAKVLKKVGIDIE